MRKIGQLESILRDLVEIETEISLLYKDMATASPLGSTIRRKMFHQSGRATCRAIINRKRLSKILDIEQSLRWLYVPGI